MEFQERDYQDFLSEPIISVLSRLYGLGDVISGNTYGAAAWPAANRAYYMPIVLPKPYIVRAVALGLGTVSATNFDVGVYNFFTLNKVFSLGSTARSGSSAAQVVTLSSPVILLPGRYYIAMAADATGQYWRSSLAASTQDLYGIKLQSSAFPLPATATPATQSDAYHPIVCLRNYT
jgi:hypothetical protein